MLGDRLTAKGVERHRAVRSGIYDITVTRQDGAVIAEFRGHSRIAGRDPGVVERPAGKRRRAIGKRPK